MKKKLYPLFITMAFLLTTACGSSNLNDNDNEPLIFTASAAMAPQIVPQISVAADHGGGFGWKKDRCFLCHSMRALKTAHEYSPALSACFPKFGEADTGICLYCHGANGLAGVTADTYRCMHCHTDETIVDTADMFAGCNVHDMDGNGWIDNADCVICHAFSDMNGKINLAIDFRKGASKYSNISEFCLNCHDGNGAFGVMPPGLSTGPEGGNIYSTYMGRGESASVRKQTADIHGARNGPRYGPNAGSQAGGHGGQCGHDESESGSETTCSCANLRGRYAGGTEIACLMCHQVHSSNNPYLITQTGASAKLADDTARAVAVTVTENNFTQLCAVCHTSEDGALTDNGLTTVVHFGTYSAFCTDCHYHGAGFGPNQSGLF